ncbi:MAG: class I SAM-dependent methyltransferase [Acidimicrobiia bacterium]
MDSTFWDQRYTDHPSPWSDEPNRFLVEAVEALVPGRALDLACGEGRNSLWLAGEGWSVLGVDFSEIAVGRANQRAAEQKLDARFERHDLTTWAPSPGTFDLVSMVYLQVPAEQMAVAVGNASRAVAPGGTLFVVGHHLDNLALGVGGPPMPEVLYTEDQLVEWCAGVEVVRSDRVERPVDGGVAIDALLLGRR